MTPLLACGACADEQILGAFPFLFYWIIVFLVWSLPVGVPLGIAGRKHFLPVKPWRYFLLALGLILTLGLLMQGSVTIPLAITIGISLVKVGQSLRDFKKLQPPPLGITLLAYRIQKIYLTVCLLAIPVGYLRLFLQIKKILPGMS
jgi:hypothetical protein